MTRVPPSSTVSTPSSSETPGMPGVPGIIDAVRADGGFTSGQAETFIELYRTRNRLQHSSPDIHADELHRQVRRARASTARARCSRRDGARATGPRRRARHANERTDEPGRAAGPAPPTVVKDARREPTPLAFALQATARAETTPSGALRSAAKTLTSVGVRPGIRTDTPSSSRRRATCAGVNSMRPFPCRAPRPKRSTARTSPYSQV